VLLIRLLYNTAADQKICSDPHRATTEPRPWTMVTLDLCSSVVILSQQVTAQGVRVAMVYYPWVTLC
jgi:hypothetical protein